MAKQSCSCSVQIPNIPCPPSPVPVQRGDWQVRTEGLIALARVVKYCVGSYKLEGSFCIFNKQVNDSWVDMFLCSSCGITFICMQSNTSVPWALLPDIRGEKKEIKLCFGRSRVEKQRRKTDYSNFLPHMNAFSTAGRAGPACSHTRKKKVICCILEKPELHNPAIYCIC